jgi:hypothetical protein
MKILIENIFDDSTLREVMNNSIRFMIFFPKFFLENLLICIVPVLYIIVVFGVFQKF